MEAGKNGIAERFACLCEPMLHPALRIAQHEPASPRRCSRTDSLAPPGPPARGVSSLVR
jgi:hypothetical protein